MLPRSAGVPLVIEVIGTPVFQLLKVLVLLLATHFVGT